MLTFKWPEMRALVLELIAEMQEGHRRGRFSIPAIKFLGVFAADAHEELAKVAQRGDIHFTPEGADGGSFVLREGERALFDLHREGLVLRLPARMSGTYAIRSDAFRIEFNRGEELEGCKRIFLLICNRIVSVDVSRTRVDVRSPSKIFDLHVELE